MSELIRRFGMLRDSAPLIVGVSLMLGSVFFIALGSVFARMLLTEIPPGQVLWLRFVGFLIVMTPITLAMRGRELLKPHLPARQITRGILGLAVALLVLLSIREIGVSQAIAAFYVYPSISYAISIFWLGERSSTRTWAAVGLGFTGVLIALNPDFRDMSAGVGYAAAAAVLASIRITMHKTDSIASSPMVSALWDRGFGAILATVAVVVIWTPMSPSLYNAVAGLILCSVAAQLLLVYAIARAPLGALAPFTFWEVVFVFLLDVLILGATASQHMVVGGVLIVTSGLALGVLRLRQDQAR